LTVFLAIGEVIVERPFASPRTGRGIPECIESNDADDDPCDGEGDEDVESLRRPGIELGIDVESADAEPDAEEADEKNQGSFGNGKDYIGLSWSSFSVKSTENVEEIQ
jgi:hypothetical protein